MRALIAVLAAVGALLGLAPTAHADRPYCETGGYDASQGQCVGGPYGPSPVKWLPSFNYPAAPAPSSPPPCAASLRCQILGDEPTIDSMHIRTLDQFAQIYSKAVCTDDMPADPTRHRIWVEVSVWTTQTNLTRRAVEQGIGHTIATYCPQYNGVFASYQSYY